LGQDAVNRTVAVSQNADIRALIVHALHDKAKQFYEHYRVSALADASDDAHAAREQRKSGTDSGRDARPFTS
jgi:hypothetical protein